MSLTKTLILCMIGAIHPALITAQPTLTFSGISVVVQFESCRLSSGVMFAFFEKPDDFLNRPDVIGDPSLNRWRCAERHVFPVEIVNHHENGDLRFVVFDLLAETVR